MKFSMFKFKKFQTTLLATCICLMVFSLNCQQQKVASKNNSVANTSSEVIVYGRNACGITSALRRNLDAAGISYTYRNVDQKAAGNEMWNKLAKTSWYKSGTSIGLPVVDVKGSVIERPSVQEIQDRL